VTLLARDARMPAGQREPLVVHERGRGRERVDLAMARVAVVELALVRVFVARRAARRKPQEPMLALLQVRSERELVARVALELQVAPDEPERQTLVLERAHFGNARADERAVADERSVASEVLEVALLARLRLVGGDRAVESGSLRDLLADLRVALAAGEPEVLAPGPVALDTRVSTLELGLVRVGGRQRARTEVRDADRGDEAANDDREHDNDRDRLLHGLTRSPRTAMRCRRG